MNNEVIKPGLVVKVVDKLEDKKIVIGGNKFFYKNEYHLKYSQEIVDDVISAFLQSLEDIVEEGDSIKLNGYFQIEPKFSKARLGRNVKANETCPIPAQHRVKIKVGTKLKRACDKFNEKISSCEEI